MSKLPIIALYASAVLMGGALAAQAPVNGRGDVACSIRATRDGDTVTLEAVANAKRNVSGTYRFAVQKAAGEGDSDIQQGGDFSLRPGSEGVLGEVALGGDQAAHYTAELKLEWSTGKVSCSRASS